TISTEMSGAQIQTAKLVAKPQSPSAVVRPKPMSDWGVQLVGDRSEITALTVYRQLQKKHEAILGGYEPVVIRTTVKMSSAPIWNRIRICAVTREAAQALCSRLRGAGENCLVQHNKSKGPWLICCANFGSISAIGSFAGRHFASHYPRP